MKKIYVYFILLFALLLTWCSNNNSGNVKTTDSGKKTESVSVWWVTNSSWTVTSWRLEVK